MCPPRPDETPLTENADMHIHSSSFVRCFAAAVLPLLLLTAMCSARAKKDVLQFTNGDRVTCEIIKLARVKSG